MNAADLSYGTQIPDGTTHSIGCSYRVVLYCLGDMATYMATY